MGIGIALGGVAKGLESAADLDLRRQTIMNDTELRKKALSIRSREVEAARQRDLLGQADKIIGEHLKIVGSVIESGKAAGNSPEQISAAIEPILADVDRLSAATGGDSSVYRTRVNSLIVGPTAAEAATAAGGVEAEKKLGEAKALEAQGIDPKTARETAGIGLGGKLNPFDRALLMSTGGMPVPASPATSFPAQPGAKSFASEAELQAAFKRGEVEVGDTVTVGGKRGTFR